MCEMLKENKRYEKKNEKITKKIGRIRCKIAAKWFILYWWQPAITYTHMLVYDVNRKKCAELFFFRSGAQKRWLPNEILVRLVLIVSIVTTMILLDSLLARVLLLLCFLLSLFTLFEQNITSTGQSTNYKHLLFHISSMSKTLYNFGSLLGFTCVCVFFLFEKILRESTILIISLFRRIFTLIILAKQAGHFSAFLWLLYSVNRFWLDKKIIATIKQQGHLIFNKRKE